MDNLIHASANDSDAEREIKLWFKPNDIPPFMHSYPTEASRDFYFFRENKLCLKEEPGSRCFIVPGETAWKSDLETLRLQQQGVPASNSFESVVAKYLINEKPQTT